MSDVELVFGRFYLVLLAFVFGESKIFTGFHAGRGVAGGDNHKSPHGFNKGEYPPIILL
jgi:hypothetical protein